MKSINGFKRMFINILYTVLILSNCITAGAKERKIEYGTIDAYPCVGSANFVRLSDLDEDIKVKWESSNPSVIKISTVFPWRELGYDSEQEDTKNEKYNKNIRWLVYKKTGTATITATYKGKKYSKEITVKKNCVFADKKDIKLKKKTAITLTVKARAALTYTIENTNVVSCKWGEWEYDKKYSTLKLFLTPENEGKTTIVITNTINNQKLKINVSVGNIEYDIKPYDNSKTGDITGNITYYYNSYRGHVPDTGATVYLIPKNGYAKNYTFTLKTFTSKEMNKSGIYYGTVDGMGSYTIQDVPAGEYLIFVISSKTSSEDFFNGAEQYHKYIANILNGYLNNNTAQIFAERVLYNKFLHDTITIKANKKVIYGFDFGMTYY